MPMMQFKLWELRRVSRSAIKLEALDMVDTIRRQNYLESKTRILTRGLSKSSNYTHAMRVVSHHSLSVDWNEKNICVALVTVGQEIWQGLYLCILGRIGSKWKALETIAGAHRKWSDMRSCLVVAVRVNEATRLWGEFCKVEDRGLLWGELDVFSRLEWSIY